MPTYNDNGVLAAALIGYTQQRDEIDQKIQEIRKRLGRPSSATTSTAQQRPKPKHRISAEGRARIAAAQRKRWAASKKADAVKPAPGAKARTAAG